MWVGAWVLPIGDFAPMLPSPAIWPHGRAILVLGQCLRRRLERNLPRPFSSSMARTTGGPSTEQVTASRQRCNHPEIPPAACAQSTSSKSGSRAAKTGPLASVRWKTAGLISTPAAPLAEPRAEARCAPAIGLIVLAEDRPEFRLLAPDHAADDEEGAIEKLAYYEKQIPPHWKGWGRSPGAVRRFCGLGPYSNPRVRSS